MYVPPLVKKIRFRICFIRLNFKQSHKLVYIQKTSIFRSRRITVAIRRIIGRRIIGIRGGVQRIWIHIILVPRIFYKMKAVYIILFIYGKLNPTIIPHSKWYIIIQFMYSLAKRSTYPPIKSSHIFLKSAFVQFYQATIIVAVKFKTILKTFHYFSVIARYILIIFHISLNIFHSTYSNLISI